MNVDSYLLCTVDAATKTSQMLSSPLKVEPSNNTRHEYGFIHLVFNGCSSVDRRGSSLSDSSFSQEVLGLVAPRFKRNKS